ncbi:MAG: hypothetical protein Q8K04_11055 [Lutibacter sp.]|nr:hypothetical protein [Lutibacter sp.]MDP3945141.1 hypothetical protein [Lutibacter sp.]
MKTQVENYETKKNSALNFMKNGQLNAYFEALVEMNNYKKLMFTVCAN